MAYRVKDGFGDQRAALVNAASLDQSLSLAPGGHGVIVQAWDATGAVFKTPLTITVAAQSASTAALSP